MAKQSLPKKSHILKKCSYPSCDLPFKAKGYCGTHWARFIYRPSRRSCSVEDCHKISFASSLCGSHYYRSRKYGNPFQGRNNPGIGTTPSERFWSKVLIGEPDECWEWQGSYTTTGYGLAVLCFEGVRVHRSNRIAWTLANNRLPELHILHSCDNRKCCNPVHLRQGTNYENVRDCIERGRKVTGCVVGEQHPHAKLTENDVREIRGLLASGVPQWTIAKRFGLKSRSPVCEIKAGRGWRHVK